MALKQNKLMSEVIDIYMILNTNKNYRKIKFITLNIRKFYK